MRREDSRLVALALCLVGSALVLGAGVFWDAFHGAVLGALLIATSLTAYAFLTHFYLGGVWLLALGCMVTDLLALQWYPFGTVAALLALPTGLAALFIGRGGGLATAVFASLVVWRGLGAFIPSHDGSQVAAIMAIWGTTALIWISLLRTQHTVEWSWEHYEEARRLLSEAQEQHLELKQTQEDLIQANRQLAALSDRLKVMHQIAEEARRAKEEFVARVSHELRTPLNMVIGFSDMISRAPHVYGARLRPALLADIAAIQRNSQHLASLVDDVLALSQIEAGRMTLSKEWTAIQEIVGAAVLAVQPLVESKGLSLELEVPPDLPPVFCDSTRVRQVILNLLSNAGRFTEQGSVRVEARCEENRVVVCVADTGPGISRENQKKMFEPFEQLDGSIRRRYGGSGLGLSISKRFVEMHDGEMWLESEVGVGTRVYFSLPLETLPLAPLAEESVARWFSPYLGYRVRTERSKAPELRPVPRFILLEQGSTLQRFFGRHIDNAEVVSVRDNEAAISELQRAPAQALIVNDPSLKHMPVTRAPLANVPYGTPVVTCWIPGEEDAAQELGATHYLVKPIACETLLAALEGLGESIKTVLLVDDEPEALQLFARMLSSAPAGYRVLRATNGRQALNLLRRRRPDVLLLDLVMPEMNGFEVLREKNQDPALRPIPVVVISARDPVGEPIVSNALTVTRDGGLSVVDLVACVQSISRVLAPAARPADQERPGKPVA
ncbi:MAG: hybrid sensor histidine kinase/response regulator [Anaerolineae bacterium]|nr:hybrid sensor histidine kinase/response regulator [Anaerolineae bacterium]